MKILIIDNEKPVRQGLIQMLELWCTEVQHINEADSVNCGLKAIAAFAPDIVLLDVEMEDGTGFDLMRLVPHPAFQLIFITAHNKYAIHAFRCAAIDFLLKPIDPLQLKEAIDRAAKQIQQQVLAQQISILLHHQLPKPPADQKIVLKDTNGIHFVKASEILYCEAEGSYTKFHFSQAKAVVISRNLKEFETILEPFGFIRNHHSYLANPQHIIRYDRADGGMLIFEGGQSIPVSQRRKDVVLQQLSME
jgi:two-component system LytT family response regulator